MPSHYNQQSQQNDNPVIETFYAPQTPTYYKPDGTKVMVGSPLHKHADGTIMTEHSMEPNDNSVVVTTQFNEGGMLVGPSHDDGGIPAIVDGQEPIELEGGEFIINAQTTAALGEDFLHKLNSTETDYHSGGYGAGQLPSPSQFKNGGKVVRRNNSRRTRPVPTKRRGGQVRKTQMRRGGRPKKMPHGGMHNSCPPGMTMGANGGCVPMSGGGGYRRGGRVNSGRKMQSGGSVNRKYQTGGVIQEGRVYNSQIPTNKVAVEKLRPGQISPNHVGGKTRTTRGGPIGRDAHSHTIIVDVSGNGHTSSHPRDGHFHHVKNGRVDLQCPPGMEGCHSHEF